jgi:hypothetical protein
LLGFWALIFVSNVLWWPPAAYDGFVAFLPVVFGYFLIRLTIETPDQLRRLVYWLVALMLFQAVNGIVQYHTGIGLGEIEPLPVRRIRGTGVFNDPNDLALTMVIMVPFLLGMITRVAAVATLATILLATYYTNSRGGVLGLAGTLIAYWYRSRGKVAALLVSAILLVALLAATPSRASELGSDDESAQGRIQAWAAGWSMLKSNPMLGVGYGRFVDYHERSAHNSFVHAAAELGLPGGMCLVGMFFFYFRGLRGSSPVGTEPFPGASHWPRDLFASGVGLIACCWFLSRQYVFYVYLVLALGACYSALAGRAAGAQERLTARTVLNIFLITLVVLATVYISVRTMAVWSG